MKTDDLVRLLAEDTRPPVNLDLTLVVAALCGTLAAAVVFFAMIGPRHDLAQAVETVRFLFKFAVTLSLVVAAGALLGPVVRPGINLGRRQAFLFTPVVLLLGSALVELAVTPSGLWMSKLVGQNALHCLTVIPFLSLFPAVPLFFAMRYGAPESPGFAGVVAALASVGIAATLYASNCFDDSPLFVAMWYPIAALVVAIGGYFAGRRFLQW